METTPELETRTLLQHEEPPSMEDVQFLVSLRVDSSAEKPQIIISFLLYLYKVLSVVEYYYLGFYLISSITSTNIYLT